MTALTEILSLRVPIGMNNKIKALSLASKRKKSDILLEWIKEKLELEIWQIEETNKAIELADAGEMATNEEILLVKNKWKI